MWVKSGIPLCREMRFRTRSVSWDTEWALYSYIESSLLSPSNSLNCNEFDKRISPLPVWLLIALVCLWYVSIDYYFQLFVNFELHEGVQYSPPPPRLIKSHALNKDVRLYCFILSTNNDVKLSSCVVIRFWVKGFPKFLNVQFP